MGDRRGLHSHQYNYHWPASVDHGNILHVHEFNAELSYVDDWTLPRRPTFNWSYPDDVWWQTRSGNFVHENLYQATFIRTDYVGGGTEVYENFPTKTFKLSDDVLLVPVVVVSWIRNIPAAGSAASQDRRDKLRASFDFIPFEGSQQDTMPTDGSPYNNLHNPETPYWPPDDIWTQCGIQFQVTHVFKFASPLTVSRPANSHPPTRFWDVYGTRDTLISAELGNGEADYLFNTLAPVFVEVGYLDCFQLHGKAVLNGDYLQLDQAAPGITLAHELGHIFGLSEITGATGQLMSSASELPEHTQLSAAECQNARAKAAPYSQRFRDYNAAVGRVFHENPLFTAVPEIHEGDPNEVSESPEVCCAFEDYRYFDRSTNCVMGGGKPEPLSKCTECCLVGPATLKSLKAAPVRSAGEPSSITINAFPSVANTKTAPTSTCGATSVSLNREPYPKKERYAAIQRSRRRDAESGSFRLRRNPKGRPQAAGG